MIIAVDFDGTCLEHNFPELGADIGAVPILKRLVANGHKLILWTMRHDHTEEPYTNDPDITTIKGNYLTDSLNWFLDNEIELWGVQTNPDQYTWTGSPKCYANLYIDDAALGCPLIFPGEGKRPYADWFTIGKLLEEMKLI